MPDCFRQEVRSPMRGLSITGQRLSQDRTARGTAALVRRWLPLLALLALAILVFASGANRWLSLEAIVLNKGRLEAFVDANLLLALAIFCLSYVAIIALSIPGSLLMTVLGGLVFPFWIGAPAVIVSATAGATVLFLVARSSIGEALRSRGGEAVARMTAGLRTDAASYMLFLRLTPVFPFALVNLAPALVGIPLWTFVWTTFVGIMPASIAFTLAANSLDSMLDEKKAAFDACVAGGRSDCALAVDLALLINPKLLMGFAALGLLAMVPVLSRRFLSRRGGAPLA
jgi:uncharacterized membrane protein YdjX (TVP38/TMEM64 family)